MRILILIYIQLIVSVGLSAQSNFFTTVDFEGYSQSDLHLECNQNSCFLIGPTICSTGECGLLVKYNANGEVVFVKELENIDINSYNSMTIRNDSTIMITGLAKPEYRGLRTLEFDFNGNVLKDMEITKDTTLETEWPVDALYLESYYLVAVQENYEGENRRSSVYKIDYEGNLIDHMRIPYYWRGDIYTLTQLNNGNLFIDQAYLDYDDCSFELEEPTRPNAVIFYEVDIETLEIKRSKDHICYKSTKPLSYDVLVLPNGNFIRTVIKTDVINEFIANSAIITYSSEWNVIDYYDYPFLIYGNPLATYGVGGLKVFLSNDPDYYYILGGDRYPVEGIDYPYANIIVEKWHVSNTLVWSKIITDPEVHNRLLFSSLSETNDALVLGGTVWPNFDVAGTRDLAIMTLDHDGCYNGNCSDTIYINGGPVATEELGMDRGVKVFPNPSHTLISVDSDNKVLSYEIHNINAQIVLENPRCNSEQIEIDLSNLENGIYFITITTEVGEEIHKLIKI